MLLDIDGDAIEVAGLPPPPQGARVDRVDVIVQPKPPLVWHRIPYLGRLSNFG